MPSPRNGNDDKGGINEEMVQTEMVVNGESFVLIDHEDSFGFTLG
jgi:hypothetical protein